MNDYLTLVCRSIDFNRHTKLLQDGIHTFFAKYLSVVFGVRVLV